MSERMSNERLAEYAKGMRFSTLFSADPRLMAAELQQLRAVKMAAKMLRDRLCVCHACGAEIVLDGNTYCEGCPSDCEEHGGPECRPLADIVADLDLAMWDRNPRCPTEDGNDEEKESIASELQNARAELERLRQAVCQLDGARTLVRLNTIEPLQEELRRIEQVIEFAESPIERKGRDLHDWLAQVLQVMVMDNGKNEIERLRKIKAAARDALDAGESR